MNIALRSNYAEYIAKGIRYSEQSTGLKFPDNTIIITSPLSALSELDSILGYPIYVSEIETSADFHISFPSKEVFCLQLLKAFNDYLNLYIMERD